MQKSPDSQPALRIGRARAQQHGGRVDGTARQNIMFCYYFYSCLRPSSLRKRTVLFNISANQRCHLAVGQLKPLGPHFGQQLRPQVQRSRNRRDEH